MDDTPDLPPASARALDEALATLGLTIGPSERAAIDGHLRLLLAWNRAINLTAIDDPVRAAVAHVADSLTAVPILRARGVDRFVDLGSGGGFPGIPLGVALPANRALLVDSIGKKTRFLETVVAAIGSGPAIEVATTRAETLAADRRHRERWPAVTARAVASLADLIELAFPLLRVGGLLVAWKGELEDEWAAAERALRALGGGTLEIAAADVLIPGHRLVLATKHGRTDPAFPRDPAARRRTRW